MTATLSPPVSTPTSRAARAVVIGAGIGGLAAGIRLAARGYRVTVVDRLDGPGGRAYVHRQDGFTFDAGPTIVTAPFLLEELWALAGRSFSDEIDLRLMDPFYRIRFHDGETFDYSGDPERVRAEIARFEPADVEGYDRYMAESEKVFRVGFEQLGDVPFDSIFDMLKVVPDLIRLGSHRSVYAAVSKHIRNERIRQVLSFHPLLVGGNPMDASSVYTLISFLERKWGVHSAIGGTGAIVDGMVSLLDDLKGELRLGATVERIRVENGRAVGLTLEGGEELDADVVVSNADAAWTYRHLVDPHHRRRWSDAKVERSRYSSGLFVWYFGTEGTYPDVKHHTIMLGPRYRGLLKDIFHRKTLAEDFSLYLHRPTATDPSLAPEGCDTFYALVPVPHLGGDVHWEKEAEPFRNRIQALLEDSLLPGLGDRVKTSLLFTPLDFEKRLLSFRGAGFSFEPTLTQSAWFRPHNRSEDVEGLYLVGAGTHPGAGLPGVLSSARVLDRIVPAPERVR